MKREGPMHMSDYRAILSGEDRRWFGSAIRCAAAVAEPFYDSATRLRNRLFDRGWKRAHDLGRPTISIGNITAGGTGKTPMVQWLASRLRDSGKQVAVLARGYKSAGGQLGDEQRMLLSALNTQGKVPVEFIGNPDRVAAARELLARQPEVNLFLLDDGFQHRRARRDLDVVLISAPEPFGFDHVLPRGLLRESLDGLKRAGALVLTHCDLVTESELATLQRQLRRYNPTAPIYQAIHAHVGFRIGHDSTLQPIERLAEQPFFVFAGIGAPDRLEAQLRRWGDQYRGARWLADHAAYDRHTLAGLQVAAREAGAMAMLTTEKDWVKLADIPAEAGSLPIWRLAMELRFLAQDESKLWEQISTLVR